VATAVDALVAAKPHFAKSRTPKPDPSQGPRGSGLSEKRMGDIFKGK
jgi:hypothetical protein